MLTCYSCGEEFQDGSPVKRKFYCAHCRPSAMQALSSRMEDPLRMRMCPREISSYLRSLNYLAAMRILQVTNERCPNHPRCFIRECQLAPADSDGLQIVK